MSYSSLGAQVWHVLTRDRTVLLAITHTFIHKWNESYLPLTKLQSIAALWLVFSSTRPAEDRRLSWPGWLGEVLRWQFV